MNYREVKCSDRLPELKDREQGVSDWVLCYWKDTDDWGETFYDYGNEIWDGNNDPEFWLEPYELPTEEEIIKDELRKAVNWKYLQSVHWGDVLLEEDILPLLAKAITNLLKGDR